MALLGIDLGGTKLALAILSEEGNIISRDIASVGSRSGAEVGELVTGKIREIIAGAAAAGHQILGIGISVPGISHVATGTVWAPNIPGWDDYPLLKEVEAVAGGIPVKIDSDRACYILGEAWQGNARGCRDAIFLSVGTGIGAGIMINGEILRGSHDIAGCIGWMALKNPYDDRYKNCGCFEYHASGEGITKVTRSLLAEKPSYNGELRRIPVNEIKSADIFLAFDNGDPLAKEVITSCIGYWGMAIANLVSLFNPEKIILGGGVFGPAVKLIPAIMEEALKWAQPVGRQPEPGWPGSEC